MSRPLLVATRSRGKQEEFRGLLAPLGRPVVFPDDVGLPYSEAEDLLETADTFEGNARIKAEWFAVRSGIDTVADDSGLEVDALGGAPGVHSKRFAGIDGPDHEVSAANNAALLRRLDGVPMELRGARYRCVLVCLALQEFGQPPNGAAGSSGVGELVVEGVTAGRILEAAVGGGGFGYDPLFLSDELGISFGEATAAAKGAVSHRGRAVAALIRLLTR
ncbi:MAG TPA: non-canonical purine NTP pyrophosphatase [Gemmatimonadales bacterium]|nr:non-canonical purine NTP pyrophosphatase [Gemmatimonadales bacterium]